MSTETTVAVSVDAVSKETGISEIARIERNLCIAFLLIKPCRLGSYDVEIVWPGTQPDKVRYKLF